MTNRDVDSFNARADRYDADFQGRRYHRPIQQAIVRIAARLAPAPRALLDVGCGTGSTLALFAARYPGAALYGVDPAAEMLRVAQTRLGADPRVHLLNAAAERLPFDEQTFDLVVSSNSFHHWADQGAGIREVSRVLAPEGHFVMTDPFAIGWHRWRARLRPHGRMRTKGEVETMLDAAGLSGVVWERVHVLGPLTSYFVIAGAPPVASMISTAPPASPPALPRD